MNAEQVAEFVSTINEQAFLADEFAGAFLGICYRFGQEPVALYDIEKCLTILMERDGVTYDEAAEWLDCNTLGTWVGDGTPAFVRLTEQEEA